MNNDLTTYLDGTSFSSKIKILKMVLFIVLNPCIKFTYYEVVFKLPVQKTIRVSLRELEGKREHNRFLEGYDATFLSLRLHSISDHC